MNLTEIVAHANNIAEESISVSVASGYINDAIAKINVQCKASFPFVNENAPGESYTAFDETWQRTLLVPFVVGRIKQMDSSQFEYSDAYSEFMANLEKFEQNYTIPTEYQSEQKNRWASEDFTVSPWGW